MTTKKAKKQPKKAVKKANPETLSSILDLPPNRTYGPAWHVHHQGLFEYTHNINERISYINLHKPSKERRRRLRLLHLIESPSIGKLLKPFYDTAFADFSSYVNDPFRRQERSLSVAWTNLVQSNRSKIRRILGRAHREECHRCPWNGRTIFPKAKEK